MTICLHDALQQFRQRTLGTFIRGQRVDGVELTIDDLGDRGWRHILCVHFKENPVEEGSTPEEKLLARVFDETPGWAQVTTQDAKELVDWLVGAKPVPGWTLSDELGGTSNAT